MIQRIPKPSKKQLWSPDGGHFSTTRAHDSGPQTAGPFRRTRIPTLVPRLRALYEDLGPPAFVTSSWVAAWNAALSWIMMP